MVFRGNWPEEWCMYLEAHCIMVEEILAAGTDRFPVFNPIVELSLTYHNNVTGANGQRQAMYLDKWPGTNTPNFNTDKKDTARSFHQRLQYSIQMAENCFQQRN